MRPPVESAVVAGDREGNCKWGRMTGQGSELDCLNICDKSEDRGSKEYKTALKEGEKEMGR